MAKKRIRKDKTPKAARRGWDAAIDEATEQLQTAGPRKKHLLEVAIDWFRQMADAKESCPGER